MQSAWSVEVLALRRCMPDLIALYPDREALLQAFETLSRLILAAIDPSEQRQAWRAIQFVLIDFGYVALGE